jgi:hypothetical protein
MILGLVLVDIEVNLRESLIMSRGEPFDFRFGPSPCVHPPAVFLLILLSLLNESFDFKERVKEALEMSALVVDN